MDFESGSCLKGVGLWYFGEFLLYAVGVVGDEGIQEILWGRIERKGWCLEGVDDALKVLEECFFDMETSLKYSFCQFACDLYVNLLLHL